ncbi:MAG TPA: hypothetical protein PK668_14740 [Myxococcota bacterium]|nr:hypothetical protein [Myxococcota bacterium]HRY93878.1 hypothetical protein [Myxococcota bacterium]HSA23310.1 hypothetical protein [Myxococcota bacterium]
MTRTHLPGAWALALALAACLLASARAAEPSAADGPAGAPVEEVEDVEVVAAGAPAPAAPAEFGLAQVAGRLHPALVHLPIAWLLLWLLLDGLALGLGREGLRPCGLIVGCLAGLACVPAALSGWLRSVELLAAGASPAVLPTHRALMWTTTGLTLALALTRFGFRRGFPRGLRWPFLLALAGAVGLMGYAAHLGGKMVFGADFLPF